MNNDIPTPRLLLRPLTEFDATQTYADWLNDPSVNQYLETRHEFQTIDSCRAFIEFCNQDLYSHLFGIFLKENDMHIGNAKLGYVNKHHCTAELSMFIGEKTLWGKGFATETVYNLTKYGFNVLELERIQAGCYEENLVSLHIFLKLRYTVEGFFRRHVNSKGRRSGCFWLGILKDEFV